MFRNLIFDWSGTLVDDLGPVIEATNAVLGKYDIDPFDREGFRRRFRLPYREFYTEILPHVPLDELEAHFRPAFDAAVTPVTDPAPRPRETRMVRRARHPHLRAHLDGHHRLRAPDGRFRPARSV